MGSILRVNLTNGNIHQQDLEKTVAHKFVGGRGLNGYTLYNEVDHSTDPLGPENRLLFGVGPCNGTISVGSGRCTVTSKSPLTGIFGDSNFGGNWGGELKYCGYDQIVIEGMKLPERKREQVQDGRPACKRLGDLLKQQKVAGWTRSGCADRDPTAKSSLL